MDASLERRQRTEARKTHLVITRSKIDVADAASAADRPVAEIPDKLRVLFGEVALRLESNKVQRRAAGSDEAIVDAAGEHRRGRRPRRFDRRDLGYIRQREGVARDYCPDFGARRHPQQQTPA